ncbi:MAG TPA: hypothetical protein VN982_16265 [Candidatus Dormibacteraeota bacterium]|nr:hypothetical protein [Candidatus Dormibacteraeota bacterium]
MRTLLVTAAGAGSVHARVPLEVCWPFSEAALPSFQTNLEHGSQQLRISPAGSPLAFQNFLRIGDEWKAATLPNNPFIVGNSFSLVTSRIKSEDCRIRCEGEGQAEGLDGKGLTYAWDSEINASSLVADAPWFRFRTTLHLPAPVRLQQKTGLEPQIVTWLSSTSTLMEGQSGSWRRVLLEQPTRNSLGTYGNDLPALYLLDQTTGVETLMYFDFSDMGWISIENLPRFLVYRCSSLSRIGRAGTQRLGVGLLADQATGNVLPAGDINFTYWLLQRPMTRLLTPQEAVARWMQALLPLFEEKLAWPPCATSWKEFATGTVEDLQDKASAQVEAKGHTGLRAYVKSTSQLWTDAPDNFELMTITDVLWPSLLFLQLHPSANFERECNELFADLPAFYHSETHSISNDFTSKKDERADSWYPFENSLIKYPMIGSLAGSKEITDLFLDAFRTAQKLARQYNYLFPIYYQVATLQAEGAGTNYAVGGLYAWAAILANRLTGDQQYLEEARRAIHVLYTVPPDRLFHEPQELAYGALAAAELGMTAEAKYLLYEQLRMFYWYSDPSQKTHDIRGMVQAAASILYPAFKENVEAILPWTGVMKRGIVFEGLLRFMDQQRRNNFYFFENCTANRKRGPSAFIPFENLGTLELAGMTGNVGKEIYGAGESIWMYLMFEALGQSSDRELMLVNLDLLDVVHAKEFPPQKLNFILYNPTLDIRSTTITIPAAKQRPLRLTSNGKAITEKLQVPKRSYIELLAEF